MIRLLAAACLCLLTSCQMMDKLLRPKPKKEAEDSTAAKRQAIGVIEMVNPEQRFVLIRTPADILIPAGTELYSTNALGEAVKLKVTPEHKGSFLAADITSGNPQRQDVVMYQATSNQPPLPPPDATSGDLNRIAPPSPSVAPQAPPRSPGEAVPGEFLRPVPPQP